MSNPAQKERVYASAEKVCPDCLAPMISVKYVRCDDLEHQGLSYVQKIVSQTCAERGGVGDI